MMDNLSAHKGAKAREIVEPRGWEILFLPPYYSPDLNPIEQAFAKVKGMLCAVPKPAPARRSWRRWAGRSMRSADGMPRASFCIVATVPWPSCYDRRSKKPSEKWFWRGRSVGYRA